VTRATPCRSLPGHSPEYPEAVRRTLGIEAPEALTLFGNAALLGVPHLALFGSSRTPADLVLRALDLARALRGAGIPVAAGFQTPLERELLTFLLRGRQPVTICPARGIEGMRLPKEWRPALAEGRVLIVSPFPPKRRRPSFRLAGVRNRVVASLAERLLILHARPGSRVFRVAAAALEWGKPVYCLDHPRNSDLVLLGATPVDAAGIIASHG